MLGDLNLWICPRRAPVSLAEPVCGRPDVAKVVPAARPRAITGAGPAKPPVAIQPRDAARWCDQAIGKQMAGHSQFKNIMLRKGRQDADKAKVFAKLAREITVAAKAGLPDPDMNSRLRLA